MAVFPVALFHAALFHAALFHAALFHTALFPRGGGYADSRRPARNPAGVTPPSARAHRRHSIPPGNVPPLQLPRRSVPRRNTPRGGGYADSRRPALIPAGVTPPSARAYPRHSVPPGNVPPLQVPLGRVPRRNTPRGGGYADSRRPARTPAGVTPPSARAYPRRDIRNRLTTATIRVIASRARKSIRGSPPGKAVR